MNPIQALNHILTNYGRSVLQNPRQVENLLRDLCPSPEYKREVSILIFALREKITDDLLAHPVNDLLLSRLVKKLDDAYGIPDQPAKIAVQTWANVLNQSTTQEVLSIDNISTLTTGDADMANLIDASNVTTQTIEQIFKSAYMQYEIDTDGEFKVRENNLNCFIRLESEKKRIAFSIIFILKNTVSDLEKLKISNILNKDFVMVRFAVVGENKDLLWCDYNIFYEDGFNPANFIRSLKLFSEICQHVISSKEYSYIID